MGVLDPQPRGQHSLKGILQFCFAKNILRRATRAVAIDDLEKCNFTGFPKKDARLSKIKNLPYLLSDYKEGKIMLNIDFYFSNRASFMGNPVSFFNQITMWLKSLIIFDRLSRNQLIY